MDGCRCNRKVNQAKESAVDERNVLAYPLTSGCIVIGEDEVFLLSLKYKVS